MTTNAFRGKKKKNKKHMLPERVEIGHCNVQIALKFSQATDI